MQKFFERIRNERADIETLQMRIKALQLSLLPSGIRYDTDRVQTSPTDKMVEVASQVDALERKMKAKLTALNADMVKGISIVQAMPTPQYRQLITLYYLTSTKTSWDDVAAIMGYSTDHVKGYMKNKAFAEARNVNTQ